MHLLYFLFYFIKVNFSKYREQWWELQFLRTSEYSLANVWSGGSWWLRACSALCWPTLECSPLSLWWPFSEHPTPDYFMSSSILRQQSSCPSEPGDHEDPTWPEKAFHIFLLVMKRDTKLFFSGFNSIIFLLLVNMWIRLSVYWSSKNHFCILKESNMCYPFEAVIVKVGLSF